MQHYTIGIFESSDQINDAVSALRGAGAADECLTLLASAEAAEVADIVGAEPDSGVLQGALVGTGIGGALGALGTIALVAVPGVGPILASGIIATLSGSTIGGYLGTLYGMRAETNDIIEMKKSLSKDSIILIAQANDQNVAESYRTILETEGSSWTETIADENGGG